MTSADRKTFHSAPIATTEQFKSALLRLRDEGLPDSHLTMLKAQAGSPGHTITSERLAQAAEYANFNAANLQYGTMGFKLAAFLNYKAPNRADGTPMWWTTLSYSTDEADADTGHFQFVMRPELVAALREMRWVRD